MSHTLNIKIECKDVQALLVAAGRAGGVCSGVVAEHMLFDRSVVKGVGVKLPGWVYPAVFDTISGVCHYDNYNGEWGDIKQLHTLQAYYGVEVAKKAAKRQGYLVRESVVNDEIVLTVSVGA